MKTNGLLLFVFLFLSASAGNIVFADDVTFDKSNLGFGFVALTPDTGTIRLTLNMTGTNQNEVIRFTASLLRQGHPFTLSPTSGELVGKNTVTFSVDIPESTPPGTYSETLTIKLQVRAGSTSTKTIPVQVRMAPKQPDLTLSIPSQATVQPEAGKKRVTFTVVITNNGGLDSAPCSNDVLLDSNVKTSFPLAAIKGAGGGINVTTTFSQQVSFLTDKTGSHPVTVKLDTNNANQEFLETNNTATIQVQLGQ